jgi:hypothetical protein
MNSGNEIYSAQIAKDRLLALKDKPVYIEAKLVDPSVEQPDQVIKVPEPVVADSVAATLAQRGSRYGDFTDHARVCQSFKSCAIIAMPANSGRGFENLDDVAKQAIEVIFDKIARILTGDPNYDDNWHDIQGYAKLVEDRLPKSS